MPILQPFKPAPRLSKSEEFLTNSSEISQEILSKNVLPSKLLDAQILFLKDFETLSNSIREFHNEYDGLKNKMKHLDIFLCSCSFAKTFRAAELGIPPYPLSISKYWEMI